MIIILIVCLQRRIWTNSGKWRRNTQLHIRTTQNTYIRLCMFVIVKASLHKIPDDNVQAVFHEIRNTLLMCSTFQLERERVFCSVCEVALLVLQCFEGISQYYWHYSVSIIILISLTSSGISAALNG